MQRMKDDTKISNKHIHKTRRQAGGFILVPGQNSKDFAAYRRGRPDASAPSLDKSQIETLAIQIASNFTQQSGRFQLELQSIAGLKSEAQRNLAWFSQFRLRNRWRMEFSLLASLRVTCAQGLGTFHLTRIDRQKKKTGGAADGSTNRRYRSFLQEVDMCYWSVVFCCVHTVRARAREGKTVLSGSPWRWRERERARARGRGRGRVIQHTRTHTHTHTHIYIYTQSHTHIFI